MRCRPFVRAILAHHDVECGEESECASQVLASRAVSVPSI